jgi:hypothetical protein
MGILERTARSWKPPGVAVRAPDGDEQHRHCEVSEELTGCGCVCWQINPVVVLFVVGLAWALIICLLLRPEDVSGAVRRGAAKV